MSISLRPRAPVSPDDETSTNLADSLPKDVQEKLGELGVALDAKAVLHVEADLDGNGVWRKRHLVATPQRLIVFSSRELTHPSNGASMQSAIKSAKVSDGKKSAGYSIDLDVPLDEVSDAQEKSLAGGAALEVRLQQHAEPGASTQPAEHVVEVLRSTNSYAKGIARAARQLTYLKENGTLQEESDDQREDRRTCPKCGRAYSKDSTVCPVCVNKWQALGRLITYLYPYRWMVIGNGLLTILGVGLSFVPPIALAQLVDHVLPSPTLLQQPGYQVSATDYRTLGIWVVAIVASSFLAMAANMLRGQWVAIIGSNVLHDIRTQLHDHLQKLSLAFYDKRETGAVMTRVQNDVQMLQNFLLNAPEDMVVSGLTVTGVIVVMLTRSPSLTLVVLLPVPFVIFATTRYWRGLMKLWRRVWAQNSSLGARLADTLGGVRVVRAFAQEPREISRFNQKSREYKRAMIRVERKAATFYPVLGFVIGLGAPLTWFIGGRQVLEGTLTLGDLTLFTVLLQRLYEPIGVLTRMINTLTRAMTAAERVFEIMDTPPDIIDAKAAVPMPYIEGRVEFKDVTFGYEKHRPVLRGISLQVAPGEMIGLVGHSGAGKSTLINLLMRFYDVDSGAILVDGIDLRDIEREDMRSQIGVVLQEPYLFHGTVAQNIAYANPEASPGEIMAAAKAAFAHDFIVSFPDGYDALVGERGQRLSGGERQRISIARAILHNPRILILDEATASVDTQTEQQIQKALQNLVQGRTTFAIAHRLSTLRDADRLIVIKDGRISEIGTHDELMQKRGTFYKLVQAQHSMNELLAVGG